MNQSEKCQICEATADTEVCIECGQSVCRDCRRWGSESGDTVCGDWFCVECVEEHWAAARMRGGA